MAMLAECMKPGDDGGSVSALRCHPRPRSLQPSVSRVSRGHLHQPPHHHINCYHMVHTAKVQFDDLLFILLGAFLNFNNVQYAFSKNLRNHCTKMIRNILQLSTLQCDLNTIKHYIPLHDK